jgi:hypothetical protein
MRVISYVRGKEVHYSVSTNNDAAETMRENEKQVMLKLSELVVGEWYGCSSWESNIKQNTVFIHCLMQINSTIRKRTNKTDSSIILDLIG